MKSLEDAAEYSKFIFRSPPELWQTTGDHNMHQLQLQCYNSCKGRHWDFPSKSKDTRILGFIQDLNDPFYSMLWLVSFALSVVGLAALFLSV